MELVKDILINDDISTKDGDFAIGESDAQHIEHILKAKPGHFYQHPTIGVGAEDGIKGTINRQADKQIIKQNLEDDNYRVNNITITGTVDEKITSIDANRIR